MRQVHQIDNRIMDLELFCTDGDIVSLMINTYNPPLLYLTSKGKNKKQYSPSQTFCMTLRKYLEGSRLSRIEQVDMDRVVALSFDRIEAGSEIITRTLWVELLPASPNMILTEGNTIIDACLRGKKLDRLLVPGETYSLPGHGDRMDFMKFSREELKTSLISPGKKTFPLTAGFLVISTVFPVFWQMSWPWKAMCLPIFPFLLSPMRTRTGFFRPLQIWRKLFKIPTAFTFIKTGKGKRRPAPFLSPF